MVAWCHVCSPSLMLFLLCVLGLDPASSEEEAEVVCVADVIEFDRGRCYGSWIFLGFLYEYPCFGMSLVALVDRVALISLLVSDCIVHSFLPIFRDAGFRLPET